MTKITRKKQKTVNEKIEILNHLDKFGYKQTMEKFNVSRYALDTWLKLRNTTGITNSKTGKSTKVKSNNVEPYSTTFKMNKENLELAMEYFTNLKK